MNEIELSSKGFEELKSQEAEFQETKITVQKYQ